MRLASRKLACIIEDRLTRMSGRLSACGTRCAAALIATALGGCLDFDALVSGGNTNDAAIDESTDAGFGNSPCGSSQPLPPSCTNGTIDQGEADIDCGGPECPRCKAGFTCDVPNDCETGECSLERRCVHATSPPRWTPLNFEPTPERYLITATLIGQDVWLVGGYNASLDASTSVVICNLLSGTCSDGPPLSQARAEHAAAVSPDGRLFVFGGDDGSLVGTNTVEWIDPANIGPGWSNAPNTLELHNAHEAIWFRGDPFVRIFDSVGSERYDPDGDTDALFPCQRPRPADSFGIAARDHLVYLIGGEYVLEYVGDVDVFDANADARGAGCSEVWTSRPSLPPVAFAAAVAAPDGRIYAIGGEGAIELDRVDALVETNTIAFWTPVAPLPSLRDPGDAVVGPDGRIYLFGGGDPPIAYGPVFSTSISEGSSGALLMLSGSNFAADARVSFELIDATGSVTVCLGEATSTSIGEVPAIEAIVPSLPPGNYLVRARDHRSRYPVTRPFQVE